MVVATSDQPALVRIKAAFAATAIAEYFRDQGADVMLMMDSVTRFAMAQREVGLAIGEPPATRGYTPSVFALLPQAARALRHERQRGSITGLYTVLVDGDDMNEPIADAVRSILDGHIVLTRELAHAGHYPAIDVLQSRLAPASARSRRPRCRTAGRACARCWPRYRDKKDLIAIGAYERGIDPLTDQAIDAARTRSTASCASTPRRGRPANDGGRPALAASCVGARPGSSTGRAAAGASRVRGYAPAAPGAAGVAERDPAAEPVGLGPRRLLEAPQHGAHRQPDGDRHEHDQHEPA